MKRNIIKLTAIAMIATLAGACSSENDLEVVNPNVQTGEEAGMVKIYLENIGDAKTRVSGVYNEGNNSMSFVWTEGDEIQFGEGKTATVRYDNNGPHINVNEEDAATINEQTFHYPNNNTFEQTFGETTHYLKPASNGDYSELAKKMHLEGHYDATSQKIRFHNTWGLLRVVLPNRLRPYQNGDKIRWGGETLEIGFARGLYNPENPSEVHPYTDNPRVTYDESVAYRNCYKVDLTDDAFKNLGHDANIVVYLPVPQEQWVEGDFLAIQRFDIDTKEDRFTHRKIKTNINGLTFIDNGVGKICSITLNDKNFEYIADYRSTWIPATNTKITGENKNALLAIIDKFRNATNVTSAMLDGNEVTLDNIETKINSILSTNNADLYEVTKGSNYVKLELKEPDDPEKSVAYAFSFRYGQATAATRFKAGYYSIPKNLLEIKYDGSNYVIKLLLAYLQNTDPYAAAQDPAPETRSLTVIRVYHNWYETISDEVLSAMTDAEYVVYYEIKRIW